MTDPSRRRINRLDIRPDPAFEQGPRPMRRGGLPPADPFNRPRPPAPGAVSSPQIPGKVPDRSTIPEQGRLPVPKAERVIRPLAEYGTAQRILRVFELAPGQEDTKERWEQATASYEELRKSDPSLLPPIRPARTFTGLTEGLAGKTIISAEDLVPLPDGGVSRAGVLSARTKGDGQAAKAAPAAASPPPLTETAAAPVAPTAAATEPVPAPANPSAPANVDVPANAVTTSEGHNTGSQAPGPVPTGSDPARSTR